MISTLPALQRAAYARLVSEMPTASIYDEVPEGASFPYLTLGEHTEVDASPLGGVYGLADVTLVIDAWSAYAGFDECLALLAAARAALTASPLDLTAESLVYVGPVETTEEMIREPDGETRHGVLRLRAFVQGA